MKTCPNGHFYDDIRFSTCPYCGEEFARLNRSAMQAPAGQASPAGSEQSVSVLPPYAVQNPGNQAGAASSPAQTDPVGFPTAQAASPVQSSSYASPVFTPQEQEHHTVAVFQQHASTVAIRTQNIPETVAPRALPVGFLVGVSGPHSGAYFPLHEGKNFIGQSGEVSLPQDPTVSPLRHAVVEYSAAQNQFLLCPGTGDLYRGSIHILGQVLLHPYQQLRVGNSVLLFVPVCGEAFRWDNLR